MIYPSKLIEDAIYEISSLPGIGKKTALRLVLFLLKADKSQTLQLTAVLEKLRTEIQYCRQCCNVADTQLCAICSSNYRDEATICIVENIQDVLAIENTAQYRGHYHVLGGLLSPMAGIGPEQLQLGVLEQRVQSGAIKEIIFALSANIDGDTTIFYITKRLKQYGITISAIARGIAVGGELEYTDEVTLGRSIMERTPYK